MTDITIVREKYRHSIVFNQESLDRLLDGAEEIGNIQVKSIGEIKYTIYSHVLDGPFLGCISGAVGSFNLANFIFGLFREHNRNEGTTVKVSLRGLHRQLATTESFRNIQEAILISHRNIFPNEQT
jgi:hypothetical protein